MWKRLGLALAIGAVLVTGCGKSSTSSDFNAADVRFVQQMIPHHQQAVEMSDMAPKHNAGPQVTALAAQIQKAQGPEIAKMKGWLRDWDKPQTDTGSGHGGGHGDTAMGDGMMSATDMKQLASATGPGFDRMYLTGMITHHQGAVKMARTEQASGKHADAKQLAGNIIRSQEAEIATMQKLLGS